jgi:1,2-diacylglycerol 3-alpha-glucosyltransferase
VVTKWFNRGQPVVGRQLRSALDELGHTTFVLAKPKKEVGPRPGALDRDDVWDQPGVTEAAAFEVTSDEYAHWVEANGIEAIFCDQNYQFDEMRRLRERGVRTIGRFVWEHFAPEHVGGAHEAYDVVYSFTRAEQARYAELGIESPYIPWGCHPELIAIGREARPSTDPPGADAGAQGEGPSRGRGQDVLAGAEQPGGVVQFIFPAGFAGHRKPLGPVLEAFARVPGERLRLLVKAQVERRHVREAQAAADRDPRITLRVADEPTHDHLRRFASCDVCLSPARWEGLGLPLYEAIAFGMPSITNDAPPMNEAVRDGVNGALVPSHPDGSARSGITAVSPDIDELARAIERLTDDDQRARLAAGAREIRDTERPWELTVQGIGGLLERVA